MALSHTSLEAVSAMFASVCDREGHKSQGNKHESLRPYWSYKSHCQAVHRGTDHMPLISCDSSPCVIAVLLTQLSSYLDGWQWDKLAMNWIYLITFFLSLEKLISIRGNQTFKSNKGERNGMAFFRVFLNKHLKNCPCCYINVKY